MYATKMVCHLRSIYPSHVSVYTIHTDPSWDIELCNMVMDNPSTSILSPVQIGGYASSVRDTDQNGSKNQLIRQLWGGLFDTILCRFSGGIP